MSRVALTDGEYRALARFRYALRVFLRFSEDAARRAGVTPTQHQLLLAVKGWDGDTAPTISALAERLQLRLHSTTELAERAVDAGFVEIRVDPSDARRRLVGLTDQGEKLLAALSVEHRDELKRFREDMAPILRELR